MILQGNQRGGARDLALHLLKTENEHVDIHELRGFVSDNLVSALNEAHAISKGTKARQFLFSLSLNPPPNENVSTQGFLNAIARVEQELGLEGQPRAIVFHTKQGRRHCHAVYSRIDAKAMKAIPLPFTKYKLRDISRALYIEHGWKMPHGFTDSKLRDPRNFTLAQWQQAKRVGQDPKDIKTAFQDSWAISDTQDAFRQALKERGFTLARGDRRSVVAIDHRLEVYAVAKWVGIKAKTVRARIDQPENLPSVDEAKVQVAQDMQQHLSTLKHQQDSSTQSHLAEIEQDRREMVERQTAERQYLHEQQQQRWHSELLQRQARFRKGMRGVWDRITGHHRRVAQRNEAEALQALKRDQTEKDNLIFRHLDQSRALEQRRTSVEERSIQQQAGLDQDIDHYRQATKREQGARNFDHDDEPQPRNDRQLER